MGYRSDVACAFVFDDELVRDTFHVTAMTKFRDFATEITSDESNHMSPWTESDFEWFERAFTPRTMEGHPALLMKFDDMKWYPGYPVPKFVDHVMMDEAIDRGGAYAFVRLGEEDDDIEQRSDCSEQFKGGDYFYANDYVRVSRSIYINE